MLAERAYSTQITEACDLEVIQIRAGLDTLDERNTDSRMDYKQARYGQQRSLVEADVLEYR